MHKILGPCVILALAGCTLPHGGSGQTQSGVPITGSRDVQAVGFREDVTFTSMDGWSCKGTVNLEKMVNERRTSETFPVTCSNGMTGTVMMAMATHRRDLLKPGDVHYSFRLSDGTMGQFRV